MSSEKKQPFYVDKIPYGDEGSKNKFCSKSAVSWLLSALLVALIVVLAIQFLYPVVEQRMDSDVGSVHLYQQRPIEVRVMQAGVHSEDSSSEDKEEDTKRKMDTSKEKSKKTKDKVEDKKMEKAPWDMKFLIDPVDLCATTNSPDSEEYLKDPEVKMLMIVPSATGHFEQRCAIRHTWGSIAEKQPGSPIRLAFILGTTQNTTEEEMIKQESYNYGDIIQGDFEDTYRNLTTKSIVMLKWIAEHCSHAEFFLKADDDTFVNVGIVARLLANEPFLSEDKFIGGYIHRGAQPARESDAKYFVSESDYSEEEYPPYISGSAYVTTGPTAAQLFQAATQMDSLLPMEDVFVTGLLGQQIDATLIHDPRFLFDEPPRPPTWEAYSHLATAHSVTPDDLQTVWEQMTKSILDHFTHQESAINVTVFLRRK